MYNQRSLTKNSFWNWFFCITLPLALGYTLTTFITLVYLWLLWFLFQESQSRIVMILPFVYCIFALAYSICAYFRSGIAIPKSIIVGWHYSVAKCCWKYPILIILLVFCIVAVRLQWFAIYAVIVVVVITIGYYLYTTNRLDPENLDKLLAKIKDTKEFVTIRLKVIKLIYESQNYFNIGKLESLVKQLKETVKQMEKLKSDDDVKVNGELRKVAESLELRLMEKRSFK